MWDLEVSGDQFDLLLTQFMLKEAEKGHASARDLQSNPKSVEKLFREAKKLKETLSANKEASVVVKKIQIYKNLLLD
jgi:molecular chaperone DnaK (HSP70)